MADTIPILWSDDISIGVLSPVAILRAQAGPLGERTKGLLKVDISTSDSDQVRHQFDLVATALGGFRRRVLIATHSKELVYPVAVEAECFHFEDRNSEFEIPVLRPGQREADTEQEFINIVKKVFRSSQFRSLLQSLIARSNDRDDRLESAPDAS